MTFNEYFDHIVCLSQPKRIDRRFLFSEDANFRFEWFNALERENPFQSFCDSQKAIFEEHKREYSDSLLVFEDDATFQHLDLLPSIMADLPKGWDMIYFGANLKPEPEFIMPEKITDRIFRVRNAYTSHAIGYSGRMIRYIAEFYNSDKMFDAWLNDDVLRHVNAYVCSPFLSYQRPTRSDLWDRNVDYTDTFQASEELLKSIQ